MKNNKEHLIETPDFIEGLREWIRLSNSESKILSEAEYQSTSIEQEIDICLYPEQIEARFSNLVEKEFPDKKDVIYKAVNLIKKEHKNQYRDENTPYFCHLMLSAIYCFEFGGWFNEVLASLLHDILEDTEYSYQQLIDAFWEDIANIVKLVSFSVDWVTILEEEFYENIKHVWSALLVKWADRFSNILSTMFVEDKDWIKWYFTRTKTQITPLLIKEFPELANNIEAVITYLENHDVSPEQKQRISELLQIREVKEKFFK